jgi:ATP-dependent Lhr-like helicase
VRATPITIVPRSARARWLALGRVDGAERALSHEAKLLHSLLRDERASFFDDLVAKSRLLRVQVETALAELVSRGLVGSDGFTGLRALLTPPSRRRESAHGRHRGRSPVFGMDSAGRWSLLVEDQAPTEALEDDELEAVARTLLRRWGVVFRRVLDREGALPPWRDLLRVYRRLEARGEIRGGRFVQGFSGEQYALPDAVTALRASRKRPPSGALVAVSAADPLNVVGILTPGDRVPALAGNRVLFRDGVPVLAREGAQMRTLQHTDGAAPHELEAALVRRTLDRNVRAYLGSAGPGSAFVRPARPRSDRQAGSGSGL